MATSIGLYVPQRDPAWGAKSYLRAYGEAASTYEGRNWIFTDDSLIEDQVGYGVSREAAVSGYPVSS